LTTPELKAKHKVIFITLTSPLPSKGEEYDDEYNCIHFYLKDHRYNKIKFDITYT